MNAIPNEAWMDVDLRSESPEQLDKLSESFVAQMRAAADDENAARSTAQGRIEVETKLIGERPSGSTPVSSPIVQIASAVVAEVRNAADPQHRQHGRQHSHQPSHSGHYHRFRRQWRTCSFARRMDRCGEERQRQRHSSGDDDARLPRRPPIKGRRVFPFSKMTNDNCHLSSDRGDHLSCPFISHFGNSLSSVSSIANSRRNFTPYPPTHDEIQKSPESKNDPERRQPDPDLAVRMLENQCHTGKNGHDGASDQRHRGDRHVTNMSALSLQCPAIKPQSSLKCRHPHNCVRHASFERFHKRHNPACIKRLRSPDPN